MSRCSGPSFWGKRLEVLKELLPAIARLGNAASPATQFWSKETQLAAQMTRRSAMFADKTSDPEQWHLTLSLGWVWTSNKIQM